MENKLQCEHASRLLADKARTTQPEQNILDVLTTIICSTVILERRIASNTNGAIVVRVDCTCTHSRTTKGVCCLAKHGAGLQIGFVSHRFLWEHKVARKVEGCKLLSQLFSCTLIMGTKSCSKRVQSFAFDRNRALGGKSLQTLVTAKLATKVERRNFSQSRQASAPTHARRPRAHARSTRQMKDPVRTLQRRHGLPVMGQL